MESPKWVKWLFVVAVFIVATAGVAWLAGFIFFASFKANPIGKTDFMTWWTYWQHYQSNLGVSKRLVGSGLAAAALGYGAPLIALFAAMRNVRTLHGEARFASTAEIAKAGLFGKNGIIIGKWKNRFLVFPGLQFVLLAAPTRSGKGVGIVIPNLLNWDESVIVLDVKMENFLITSEFRRRHGQQVYLFNPFSMTEDGEGSPLEGKTHRYNPLFYVSDKLELRVQDIMSIGYVLFPGEGKDTFFDDASRNLFLGLTLYLCETPTLPRTIGELLRQSSGKGRPVKEYVKSLVLARNFREVGTVRLNGLGEDAQAVVEAVMQIKGCSAAEAEALCKKAPTPIVEDMARAYVADIEELLAEAGADFKTEHRHIPRGDWDGEGLPPLTEQCVDALNRFTNTSDNTLASILATFNAPLTIWSSPLVDAATAYNDFDLRLVRKERMSIYIGVPANRLAEARLIINLIYSQLIGLNSNRVLHSTPDLKFRCLILADEFAAPGRIGIIDKSNSFQAGYGLPLLTIVQSPAQIEADAPKGYGKEGGRTLMTNHACQIFYTPREQRDANEYSESLGYTTAHSRSRSHGRGGSSVSESSGEGAGQKRALMLPQELQEMDKREQIIRLENTKPIRCEKIAYYADPVFMDRLKNVSATLKKLGTKLPSKEQLEAVWGSGELAAPVPSLDLDLHVAVVQARTRELTVADVKKGIDLTKLVPVKEGIDLKKLVLDAEAMSPPADSDGLDEGTDKEEFVDNFFTSIGVFSEEESESEGGSITLVDSADQFDLSKNNGSAVALPVQPAAVAKRTRKPAPISSAAAKAGTPSKPAAGNPSPERVLDLSVLHEPTPGKRVLPAREPEPAGRADLEIER
jgi:type IV secretion system protein VirD4